MSESINAQTKNITSTHTDVNLYLCSDELQGIKKCNLHFTLNQKYIQRSNLKINNKETNKYKCKKSKKAKNEFEKNNIMIYQKVRKNYIDFLCPYSKINISFFRSSDPKI